MELDAGVRVYMKYHQELRLSDSFDIAAVYQVLRTREPVPLISLRLQKVFDNVNTVNSMVSLKAQEKILQVEGKLGHEVIEQNKAWKRLHGALEEAGSSFQKMIERASFMNHTKEGPSRVQEIFKTSHKALVEQAWNSFNEDVWNNGVDMESAASKFMEESRRARRTFEADVKCKIEEIQYRAKFMEERFFKGELDSDLAKFDEAVDQAVKKFVWSASSALEYFYDDYVNKGQQDESVTQWIKLAQNNEVQDEESQDYLQKKSLIRDL